MVAVIRPDQNTRTARALCCRCLELHLDVTVGTKPVTKPAGKSLRFYSRIAAMRRCCITTITSATTSTASPMIEAAHTRR